MIGHKIRELRRARMLTGPELARRARMSRGHLYHIENIRFAPSVATVERIAGALEIGPGRLLVLGPSEIVLEDSFVRAVKPYLRALNDAQRKHVLQMLAAAPKSQRPL